MLESNLSTSVDSCACSLHIPVLHWKVQLNVQIPVGVRIPKNCSNDPGKELFLHDYIVPNNNDPIWLTRQAAQGRSFSSQNNNLLALLCVNSAYRSNYGIWVYKKALARCWDGAWENTWGAIESYHWLLHKWDWLEWTGRGIDRG